MQEQVDTLYAVGRHLYQIERITLMYSTSVHIEIEISSQLRFSIRYDQVHLGVMHVDGNSHAQECSHVNQPHVITKEARCGIL